MKVFWSWQSDTPGKIGRHFVREVLADAIKALKEPEDIEEPIERASREALHLDHDRQGVPGSPDLAPTIFAKIAAAAVFVADVTLVGNVERHESEKDLDAAKRLINSNVAIEFGYALHALGDTAILMVQNTYYGSREALPLISSTRPVPFNITWRPMPPKRVSQKKLQTCGATSSQRCDPISDAHGLSACRIRGSRKHPRPRTSPHFGSPPKCSLPWAAC